MHHLGQAPSAKAGHQHGGDQGQCGVPRQGRHLVALHVVHHVGEALGKPAHLGGLHHQHNQGRHAHHHDESLDEVRLQGGHVAPQHQHHRRGNGDNQHAHRLVDAQDHRAHAGKALVHRGRVGDEEHKDDHAGKQPHARALEALFKQLGHGFDIVAAGQVPGAVGQHQPGQQGAEHRVSHAHQHAPQAVAPPRAPRVANEHHGGEVGCAVGEGGNPRPGAAAPHRKARHVRALAGVPNTHAQHEQGVHPNDNPNGHFLAQCPHILLLFNFKASML